MKSKKLTLGLLTLLGLLLVIQVGLSILEESVNAQVFGADRYVIMVNGAWRDNREPVYVINTREQSICVYAYNSEEKKMRLVAVRSYKWDRVIREYNNDAPTVDVIQNKVPQR